MGYFKEIPELKRLRAKKEKEARCAEPKKSAIQKEKSQQRLEQKAEDLQALVKEFAVKSMAVRPELFFEELVLEEDASENSKQYTRKMLVRLVSISSKGPLKGCFADKDGNLFQSSFERLSPRPVYVLRPISFDYLAIVWPGSLRALAAEMNEVLESGEYG
ncbi:MAG: hypothetical protein M1548_02725 [Actinobacteria bacterium]|nr:hypothetical protein [Actinomycetota bacterium]